MTEQYTREQKIAEIRKALEQTKRFTEEYILAKEYDSDVSFLLSEIDRLQQENWQLKGALGYSVPGHIPDDPNILNGIADAKQKDLDRAIVALRKFSENVPYALALDDVRDLL